MCAATVALLPACGEVAGFPEGSVRYKALLPLNGRPLADYTLRALQSSSVERIFIIQPPDGDLDKFLSPNSKNVFVTAERGVNSLAGSLVCGARAVLEYYGSRPANLDVIATPCDLPLVEAVDYDDLINQFHNSSADLCAVAAPLELLKQQNASRRFRSMYLKNLGGVYSLQSTAIGRGSLIGWREEKGSRRFAVFDDNGLPIAGLEATIDNVRRHRRQFYIWPLFMYQVFLRRLSASGELVSGLRLALDIIRRRATVDGIARVFKHALNLNA
jgi:GTP:adenosylcobinamide-phosphate guanylyltransferase